MFLFRRKKDKLPPKIKNLFDGIIERGRLANERMKNEPKEIHVMATKEEIYEEFNKLVKLNPYNLSEESLSQIGDLEITAITKENDWNGIKFKFRWNEEMLENGSSSPNMWTAKSWASDLYNSIYFDYDPQNNDPKAREAVKLAEDEADNNLAKVPRKLGFCHTFEAEQKRVLKEKYGIDWKSLSERHPNVKYD